MVVRRIVVGELKWSDDEQGLCKVGTIRKAYLREGGEGIRPLIIKKVCGTFLKSLKSFPCSNAQHGLS